MSLPAPETLLPHRAPMVLLERVLHCDDDGAAAGLTIGPDSPFFDAALGGVPAWVGLEYMAQAIALWSGHQRLQRGLAVQPAFLLGTRHFDCNVSAFPPGSTLQVTARCVYTDNEGIGAFDCRIEAGGLLATAQIKAFRPDNPQDFARQPA